VVPANVYDSLVTDTDKLQVDLAQWLGVAPAALVATFVQVDLRRWVAVAPAALSSQRVLATLSAAATAQAGAAGSITLDAGASAVNDYYGDSVVFLISGAGAGQARRISSYAGATKVASVVPNWATNPDNTSVFVVLPSVTYQSAAGAGALQRTIRCRDQASNPIEGASVWVATDAAGTNIVAGALTTDSNGIVTVLLDAGSYYVWAQKDGQAAVVGQAMTIA
jgi:hypothetical protein